MDSVIISGKRVTFRLVHWRQFMRDGGEPKEYCALARNVSDDEIEVTISTDFSVEQQIESAAQMAVDLERMFANGRALHTNSRLHKNRGGCTKIAYRSASSAQP